MVLRRSQHRCSITQGMVELNLREVVFEQNPHINHNKSKWLVPCQLEAVLKEVKQQAAL